VSRHGGHDDALSTVRATAVGEQAPAKAAPLSLLSPTGIRYRFPLYVFSFILFINFLILCSVIVYFLYFLFLLNICFFTFTSKFARALQREKISN
jgi:hypothetical protein